MSVLSISIHGLIMHDTGVERWDIAIIAGPKVITLVLRVLRRSPVIFVWVVGVHVEYQCLLGHV